MQNLEFPSELLLPPRPISSAPNSIFMKLIVHMVARRMLNCFILPRTICPSLLCKMTRTTARLRVRCPCLEGETWSSFLGPGPAGDGRERQRKVPTLLLEQSPGHGGLPGEASTGRRGLEQGQLQCQHRGCRLPLLGCPSHLWECTKAWRELGKLLSTAWYLRWPPAWRRGNLRQTS
jgi:hypothetical protein